MSSNLMETSAGGEQTQYEAEATDVQPPKQSTGQMGDPQNTTTEDASKTSERAQQDAEKGEQKAENIRYGQTISEGGMGGMTSNQTGEAGQEGFGRMEDKSGNSDGAAERRVEGYGGDRDMNREIGA